MAKTHGPSCHNGCGAWLWFGEVLAWPEKVDATCNSSYRWTLEAASCHRLKLLHAVLLACPWVCPSHWPTIPCPHSQVLFNPLLLNTLSPPCVLLLLTMFPLNVPCLRSRFLVRLFFFPIPAPPKPLFPSPILSKFSLLLSPFFILVLLCPSTEADQV